MNSTDASDFLNAETLGKYKQMRHDIQDAAFYLDVNLSPDAETRALWIADHLNLMDSYCDLTFKTVAKIYEFRLQDHEYADEIINVCVGCFIEARRLRKAILGHTAEKQGAA